MDGTAYRAVAAGSDRMLSVPFPELRRGLRMRPTNPTDGWSPTGVRPPRTIVLCGLLLLLLAPAARAQDTVEGLFISVPSPITSEVANRVQEVTGRAVQKFKAGEGNGSRSFVLVYDFSPANNGPSASPDFGPCYDLARSLRK